MRNQQNMLVREKLKTSSLNSSRIQYQEDTPIDSLPSLGYNIKKTLL